ncbi:hypothetical protein ACFX11_040954 [Malus domestica]
MFQKIKCDNMAGIFIAVDSFPRSATILFLGIASPGREAIVDIHEALLKSKECFPFPVYAPHHLRHLSNIPVASPS